jgi:hypothetical protein
MRMQRQFNVLIYLALLALLCACGSQQGVQATQIATLTPEATRTPAQRMIVPSATIPPTTSPLPSPTPQQPSSTVAPADATETALPTTQPVAINEESAIALIRERYATINRAVPQYRKTERSLDGFSTEGGTLEAFYDDTALRKIVATYLGETGRAAEEYYFWDEQVFFVFRREDTYDEPFGKVVQTKENRFYFVDNRMIRWLDLDRRLVLSTDPSFTERQNALLQQIQELRAFLPS